jgi:hypothetical protein
MIQYYEEDNLIKRFCTFEEFDKTKHEDNEFIQVGEKIDLPKEFFQEGNGITTYTGNLASDFIRSLVNGEKDFIIKEILNQSNNKTSISKFGF